MSQLLTDFKYFKDANGGLHAFAADGSQDAYIPEGLTPVETESIKDTLVPPFNLLQSQERLTYEVNALYAQKMMDLNIKYPSQERETWPIQLAEAKDLIENGESAVTPFIDALVKDQEITRLEMAEKIIQKDTEYRMKAGALAGAKLSHITAIESLTALPKKAGQAATEVYDYSANWPVFE